MIIHNDYGKRSTHPNTEVCPSCSDELKAKIGGQAAGHELRAFNDAGENAVRRSWRVAATPPPTREIPARPPCATSAPA